MEIRFFLLLLLSPAVLGLMVARCPEGWKARGGTDQCYLVHSVGRDRTFQDARVYCQARGGDLAYIDTSGLRDWLGQLVAATNDVGQNGYMWVGAKDLNGEWKWVETNQTVDHVMLPWDESGSGECAALTVDSRLIKQDCSQLLKFICHRNIQIPMACDYTNGWEDVSDRCYKRSSQMNSWYDSEVECVIDGGHLISIEGDAEQMLAHDLALEERDKVWTGYTELDHPGQFTWVDGSNSNKTYWNEGQPDLSLNGFGAAVVDNDDPSGLWMVEKVTNEFHSLCEKTVGSCLPGWETFESSCYYFNTESTDYKVWEDAKSTCEAVNAKMPVLDTNAEDAFFRNHVPEGDTVWLGLYSEPHDKVYWTDATEMSSKNYSHMSSEDEANAIANDNRQCVYLQETLDTDGVTVVSAWVPTDCNSPLHYACEAEIGTQINLIPPSNERYCPEGWEQLEDNCYFFSTDEKTWTAAENDCKKRNTAAHLVSIVTWAEQDYVFNKLEANAWIGLSDRDEMDVWKWSDGRTLSISNWAGGEPNGNTENCVEMYFDSSYWNDMPCSDLLTYSCKMPAATSPIGTLSTTTAIPDTSACGYDWTENPQTGECYRIEVGELSFIDAQQHCRELYYYDGQSQPDLVSIYSVSEQTFVFSLLAAEHLSQSAVWIGMKNDYFENSWTDGTPSAYFNFADGEPNDYISEECIDMYTADGKWNDFSCANRLPFICEKKGRNYVGPQPPARPTFQCPSGWSPFDNNCYYFSTEMTDWFTAESNCNAMLGSNLASITNQEENDFLKDFIVSKQGKLWLALRDDDNGENWHWSDGSLYDWTNWYPGEPNNAESNEHCGEMLGNDVYGVNQWNGMWNDIPCTSADYYVCKTAITTCPNDWVYKDGKCYYVSDYETTWSEGQIKCQEENKRANLVNIHSEEENQFFMEQLKHNSYSCWMGLKYNGSKWAWTDGSDVEYANWNVGEPNELENELCGEMIDYTDGDSNGKWNNLACSETRAYGCEIYPTHSVGCEDGWDAFGDYCYWHSHKNPDIALNHDQAQAYCQNLDANMVSIHSAEENDFVYSLISEVYMYDTMLGFTDIGHSWMFMWDDGTEVVYANTGNFEADLLPSSPFCGGYLGMFLDSSWVFLSCTTPALFICKKPKEATPLNPDTHGCINEDDGYHGTSCYNFPGISATWEDAKSDCESRGHHLVALNNQYETAYFSALVGTIGHTHWIGLSGSIAGDGSVSFTWVTGEALEYSYWDKYEPDPDRGVCVSASGDVNYPGLWSVRTCSDTFEYACEYERVGYTTSGPPTTKPPSTYCLYGWQHKGQRCYQVMMDAATWGDGEARCLLFGAHLASVGSESEQNVLLTLPNMEEAVNQYGNVWVGLKMGDDTGYWWTDGSATDYVNWAEGQPESHGTRESCVSGDASTLKLSDSVCLTHLPFICEAPVGTMQTTAIVPTKPPIEKCTDNADWYLYNSHCYKFITSKDEVGQTWWEAHRLCRDEGGELASILDDNENYWIESMIYQGARLSMWIGGRAKLGTGYEWLDGQPFTYDNWAKGEPNYVNDQEDCISMYTNNYGYWNDQNCGHTAGRICKRPHGSTHPPAQTTKAPDGHCPEGWIHTGTKCVYFMMDWLNFTTSRDVCRKLGSNMDLASIHSDAEQAYLTAAMVTLNQHMWIGMRYESGFMWVDQTKVSYTNWGPNEPNGGWAVEECVEVSSDTGLWNDISCSNTYGGICMMTQDPDLPDHHTPNNCPDPYDDYTYYNGACYKAVDTPQTWDEAEATCVADEAHLVSILTVSEDSFVWAATQQNAFASIWMGLNNQKNRETFAWSDGWPMTYINWARGEPAVNLTRCVANDVTDGAWYTKDCSDANPFICKYTNETAPTPDPPITGSCPDTSWKDLNGGYCYLFSNETKTWNNANLACLQLKSNMASIHSAEEMRLIKLSMETYNDPIWIGLVKVAGDDKVWSDGTGVNYINWENGEPNSEAEQCTEIIAHNGKWNDAQCDTERFYLCKIKKMQEGTIPTNPPTDTPGGGGGGGGGDGGGDGSTSGGLSGGGIAGIVIAVLFVFSAAGFVGYTYIQKPKRTKDLERQQHGFENVTYEEGTSSGRRTGGAGSVKVAGDYDGTEA